MAPDFGGVYLGEGNLAGKGVYAARNFQKGETVIQYHLTPLTEEELAHLSDNQKMFTHTHGGQLFLYAEPERFVNHSDTPNTHQDLKRKQDVALSDIKKDEMITTDSSKDDSRD